MRVYIKIIAIVKPFSAPRSGFPAMHGDSYYFKLMTRVYQMIYPLFLLLVRILSVARFC